MTSTDRKIIFIALSFLDIAIAISLFVVSMTKENKQLEEEEKAKTFYMIEDENTWKYNIDFPEGTNIQIYLNQK